MRRTEPITRTTVLLSIISSSSNKYSIAEDGFSFVHGTRRMQTRRTGASGRGQQAGQAVGIFQPFFLQVRNKHGRLGPTPKSCKFFRFIEESVSDVGLKQN